MRKINSLGEDKIVEWCEKIETEDKFKKYELKGKWENECVVTGGAGLVVVLYN